MLSSLTGFCERERYEGMAMKCAVCRVDFNSDGVYADGGNQVSDCTVCKFIAHQKCVKRDSGGFLRCPHCQREVFNTRYSGDLKNAFPSFLD